MSHSKTPLYIILKTTTTQIGIAAFHCGKRQWDFSKGMQVQAQRETVPTEKTIHGCLKKSFKHMLDCNPFGRLFQHGTFDRLQQRDYNINFLFFKSIIKDFIHYITRIIFLLSLTA